MKILMLNYEFPPIGGGAGNAMYYMLRELSKEKDIFIDVITSSPGKYQVEKFANNITVYKLSVNKKRPHYQTFSETFTWSVKTYFFIKKLLKKNGYDLCHCWTGWPSGYFGYLFRDRMPYLVSLRGTDVPGFNVRFKLLDKILFNNLSRLIWRNASGITANSDNLKELAFRTLKCDIQVIYNGIDTGQFRPGTGKEDIHAMITVSRLIKRKGLSYLLKAMADLKKTFPGIRLTIVGEGPDEGILKELSKALSIEKNVIFRGNVEHSKLPNLYNEASIFVLPSLQEGMSNALLEAMASGLAIITTDTGGTKELIKGNGIIIRKKSVQDITKAISGLFRDKKKLGIYQKRSREISMNLTWKEVTRRYIELYEDMK